MIIAVTYSLFSNLCKNSGHANFLGINTLFILLIFV